MAERDERTWRLRWSEQLNMTRVQGPISRDGVEVVPRSELQQAEREVARLRCVLGAAARIELQRPVMVERLAKHMAREPWDTYSDDAHALYRASAAAYLRVAFGEDRRTEISTLHLPVPDDSEDTHG